MPPKSRRGGPKKGSTFKGLTSNDNTSKQSEPQPVHDSPHISEAEQSDHDDTASVVEHVDQTLDTSNMSQPHVVSNDERCPDIGTLQKKRRKGTSLI